MGSLLESVTDKLKVVNVKPQTFVGSGTDSNAYILVDDFIRYVEAVEKGYPRDKSTDVLTRILAHYYGDYKFQQLIPDAPWTEIPRGFFEEKIELPRHLNPNYVDSTTYRHLTAKTNENGVQDNPSPYIIRPGNEEIDVGHAFLGFAALRLPRTDVPFSKFGVPNIDVASWVADLAITIQWITAHEKDGKPDSSAPKKASKLVTPYFDEYYKMSAPDPDLIGDADSFGLYLQWKKRPEQLLSQVLRSYYLGDSAIAPLVNKRWQNFCSFLDPKDARVMFPFTMSGNQISWDSSIIPRWKIRVDRMADLLIAGKAGAISGTISPPPPHQYRDTGKALSRFLDWLKLKLESEIQRP